MMFCKEYNARTQDQAGTIIPVEITVFEVRARSRQIAPPPTETNILARDAFSRTTRLKTQWLTHFLIHSSQTPLPTSGQVLHLRPQDPSRRRPHQEGCGHLQGRRQGCRREGRLHHPRSARGDCQDQAPRPQRRQDRVRHAHRRWHRPQHGRDHRRLGYRGVQGWLPRGEGGHLGLEARAAHAGLNVGSVSVADDDEGVSHPARIILER